MYIMFPHYEKVVDKDEEIFNKIESVLKGINNEETFANYKSFLAKFEDVDNEILNQNFIENYNAFETKEEKTQYLRQVRSELIDFISSNLNTKPVKTTFKNIKFKIKGLKYSTKGNYGEQNKLIELYKAVLTNPEVYSDVMKSIDNDLIKNDINDLKPDISDSFMSVVNPRDDIEKRYSFLGGKAGVGMEANAMTDIWRDGRLFITNLFNFKWGNYDKELEQIELDLQYSEELSEKDLEYYVSEMIDSKASSERIEAFKNEIRKIKIGETLGTILNAFVDIAKEPYITNGNWTTSTTNVGNLMLRMGVHPLYVTSFLANPIIAKYNRFQQNNEGLFDNMSGDMFNKFKQSIVQEYVGNINPKYSTLYALHFKDLNLSEKQLEDPVLVNKQQVTKNKVLNELNNDENEYNKFFDASKKYFEDVFSPNKLDLFDRTTEQYNKAPLNLKTFRDSVKNQENVDLNFQITLLNEFRNLQQSSKNLKFIVDFGKLDTNGIGKDPNTIFYLEDLLKTIIENEENTEDENGQLIKGVITNFNSKLNNTVLSKYYNNLLKIKYILLNNLSYFPMSNPVVRDIVSNIVNDVTKDYSKKEEIYTKVANQFKTYIYNQLLDITNDDRKKVLENMPNYFLKFQQENTGKYFIIDNITVKNDRLELNNSEKSEEFQNLFTQSWEELFEDHPKFAESLVKYSFLTTGFNMTRTQFYSYIPFTYFIKSNVNKKLRNIFSNNNFEEFTNKFYLNHLGDRSIVKNVLKDNLSVDEQNEHVLFSKNPKGLFIEVENKYYSLVGHSQVGYVYVEIKNQPQNNNYNVELQLYDFDESILATEVSEKKDFIEELSQQTKEVTETKPEVKSEVSNIVIFEEEQTSGYANRTKKNASADATIAFAIDFNTAGEKLTKNSVLGQGKKYIPIDINDEVETDQIVNNIVNELNSVNAKTLNIAGNGIYTFGKGENVQKNLDDYVYEILKQVVESPNLNTKIESIRSGGQTGIDEAGTKAGIKLGLKTLTLAPKGWTFRNVDNKDISNEQQFKARFGEFNKPQQLSLFDNESNFEEVKDKWEQGGYTKQDWDNMTDEERNHIIKNCL